MLERGHQQRSSAAGARKRVTATVVQPTLPYCVTFNTAQWGLVVLVVIMAAIFWLTRPVAPTAVMAKSPRTTALRADIERARPAESSLSEPMALAVKQPHGCRVRMPAEFEPQRTVILGCNELLRYHAPTMLEIVRALHGRVSIIGIIDDATQEARLAEALAAADLPADAVQTVQLPIKGMWVRDYGPIFVSAEDGTVRMLDTEYRQRRPTDDNVPRDLEQFFRVPRVDVPLRMEGGNLLSNGAGLCLTTSAMMAWNAEKGLGISQVGELLGDYFGFNQWVYVQPPEGEPTGHIDMICTLVAPNIALFGEYDPDVDPVNATILDEGAAILAGTPTVKGPMQVVRIPMPPKHDGHWRSYTNVIYANGVVLVPVYPNVSPQLDEIALKLYRHLLPNWEVVPINASTLIQKRGALHCISINVPEVGGLTDNR